MVLILLLCILAIIGMIIFIFKIDEWNTKLCIIGLFLSILIIIGCLVKYKIDYYNSHESETEKCIVTITDKQDKRELIGIINKVPHYDTRYYIYFDNEELKVDFNTYKTIEIGDKFVLELDPSMFL